MFPIGEIIKRIIDTLTIMNKKKIFATMMVVINFLYMKNVQAYEKNLLKTNQQFKNPKSISPVCKEIIGAEKFFLKKWAYQSAKLGKIIKVQLKNNSQKKKKQNWHSLRTPKSVSANISFFLAKIRESEKLNSKKTEINSFDMRISGIQTVALKKNFENNDENFSPEEKNTGFLQMLNKFSIFNPDLQSTLSVFNSYSETSKIVDLHNFIFSDPIKGYLLQTFSEKSGSFLSKTILNGNLDTNIRQNKNESAKYKSCERKTSLNIRKKKYRLIKNYCEKKKITWLDKKYSFHHLFSRKKNQRIFGNRKVDKTKQKITHRKSSVLSLSKHTDSPPKRKNLTKNIALKHKKRFCALTDQKISAKKHFSIFLRKIKTLSLSDKNIKQKHRKPVTRCFGSENYKTTFSVSKIKNYIKFLSMIKKKKKAVKNREKFTCNSLIFQNHKISNIKKNRKSFPFRNNSFNGFKKKFISKKLLNRKKKKNSVISTIISFQKIKIRTFGKFLMQNEVVFSSNKFSRFQQKTKYSNVLHSKESNFWLENKGSIHLANLFNKGKLVPRSFSQSVINFSKIAKLGNPKSLFSLGILLFQGKGIYRNKKYSFKFFKGAATRGERKGLYNMAFILSRGIGVTSDILSATSYLAKFETNWKRKKAGSKNGKKPKKSKYGKIFYHFIQNCNQINLLKCYVNSMNSFHSLSFPSIILKKTQHVSRMLNILNRSSFCSRYNSLWNLSESLIENRQFFLAARKIDELCEYYPMANTNVSLITNFAKNQPIVRLLTIGDAISANNQNIHSFFLVIGSSLLDIYVKIGFASFKFIVSKTADFLYFSFVFCKLIVFPFFN